MKTFGLIAAAVLIPIAALADTITSTGQWVGVPSNFQSTTGSNAGQGAPFWNNYSTDGAHMNVGDFLTGSNPILGSVNYLGASPTYLSTGGAGPDAPDFILHKTAATLSATLLFSDSDANYPYSWLGMSGTSIGLYSVADPNQKETLFAAGALYDMNAPNGVINNNVTSQTPVIVGSWSNYGVYAYTCGYNNPGNAYCNMYYSDATLNSADPGHQHFSLFRDPQNPLTYYIGFEDKRGVSGTEGYGDYNDVIFKLQTRQNPEPATWTAMAIGLLGIGFLRRRASKPVKRN